MPEKTQNVKSKIRKFLAGVGLVTASLVGGHKTANAQEFSDMTDEEKMEYVSNMTDEEKQKRLGELAVSLDSIDKIATEKENNHLLIKNFIAERFPFEVWTKKDWQIPVGGYIRDDMLNKLDEQIKETKNPEELSKLQDEKNSLIVFFNNCNDIVTPEGVSIAFVADMLQGRIRRMVNEEVLSPEEAKFISEKLRPYLEIKKIPTASRYDVIHSLLLEQRYKDIGGLLTAYKNGEIAPEEYTVQMKKYEHLYNVLFKTLEGANKSGDLSGASTVYAGLYRLIYRSQRIAMFKNSEKKRFEEEQQYILTPPVIQNHTAKKAKSRNSGRR